MKRIAFELFHIHGESIVPPIAQHLGYSESAVMELIADFGDKLTKPYDIITDDGLVLKTIHPVPKVDNSVKFSKIEPPLIRKYPPRAFKTDAEGFIRVKVGEGVVRMKPDELFAPLDMEYHHGVDVEALLTKAIKSEIERELSDLDASIKTKVLPHYTDDELRAECTKRGISV